MYIVGILMIASVSMTEAVGVLLVTAALVFDYD